MNKKQQQQEQILREEIARATMIMEARKLLNLEEFKHFMSELRQYESEMILAEGYNPETMYEGLMDRLKGIFKRSPKAQEPDVMKTLDQLADQLASVDMELDTAVETRRTENEIKALQAKRNVLLQKLAQIDPNTAQQAQQAADAENSADPNAKKAGNAQKQKANAQVQADIEQAMDKTDNPRADGILKRLGKAFGDTLVNSVAVNADLYGAIRRGLQGAFRGNTPSKNKDDEIMALLLRLKKLGLDIDVNKTKKETDKIPDEEEGKEGDDKEKTGEEEKEGMPKETPLSVMTRQKDVKPGKDGQKEAPLVMSIQKMGLSQPTAQQIAKRIGQYLRQRKIPIAESLNINHADRILENILKNAPKGLLYTLFEEISKEDMDEIRAAAKSGDEKQMKDAYKKMARKYHPDRGGEASDFQKINDMLGKDARSNKGAPEPSDVNSDIKSNPEKAGVVLSKDFMKVGVKLTPEVIAALQSQFEKIKREKVPREKISTALATVAKNVETGETSTKDAKIQIAGIAKLDPEKDISRQTPVEKIIRNAFREERARIRAMSKGKGVIHKVVSRFISDNQNLLKKDPALKDIFDDEARFNQFAKKIRNNIKRMLKRRGYEDSEIGNLLESTNIEEQVREAANKYLLESDK